MASSARLDIGGDLRETSPMGRLWGSTIVTPLLALPALCMAAPDDIGNSPFWVEFRPRYNHIEESDRPEVTRGGTFRLLAGWRSAPWRGLRFTAEAIVANHWGPKEFNDDAALFATSPYPLLPDPRHAGVNRAHVDWAGVEDFHVRLGRQVLEIDHRRWVSANDFRQVPQLFDGVTATWTGLPGAELMAGHYARIRSTSGDVEHARLSVVHAAWNPRPDHVIAAYGYFHDQPVTANFTGFADNSYRVLGARAEGTVANFGELGASYLLEAARQGPHAGGDSRISARYWRAGLGIGARDWTLRYDHEVRGSNDGQYGLQIPLTDLYTYNGWTLHWFTLPRQGLRDQWATARWAFGRITLYAEAHRFRSDFGALDFGRETDASITWEIRPNAVLRLQHARYDPGPGRPADPEIRKTWLTLTYTWP
jgi:hypothetical protein